jgi:PASTA domain
MAYPWGRQVEENGKEMMVHGDWVGDEVAVGRRIVRAVGTILAASLLALGICASTASAEPLSMTFTEARANVGVQLEDEALFKAPDTAPFAAQIDPGSGSITAGVLDVPDFVTHITKPIVSDVTVEFEIGDIEGSFNQATGALTLEGEAGGTLRAENGEFDGEECTVSTNPAVLEVSTAIAESSEGAPRSGVPFAAGLTGAGAIAGEWPDMDAEPVEPGDSDNVSFCNNVETQIEGPGGVWLEQEDIVPPSAPRLTSTDPASPGTTGTPRILGSAEAGSTVRVYAGPGCAGAPVATGSAAQLVSPGIGVAVADGVTASFSATATDTAGNASACSAPISYTHLKVPPACVVPKLVGKTLKAAKKKIKAASCKLGKVHKPKKRPKGKGRLVVKSSSPAAGASPADGKVDLRLGPKPRKARG